MGTIVELFKETAFDPETVKTLGAAFEKARKALHDTGQPAIVNEIIARRIISLFYLFERDPDRLCAGALQNQG